LCEESLDERGNVKVAAARVEQAGRDDVRVEDWDLGTQRLPAQSREMRGLGCECFDRVALGLSCDKEDVARAQEFRAREAVGRCTEKRVACNGQLSHQSVAVRRCEIGGRASRTVDRGVRFTLEE
tara:strand:+ start:1176 stop:1550 length:375 start_codon:yes stop_codon:yes gene_type:complete